MVVDAYAWLELFLGGPRGGKVREIVENAVRASISENSRSADKLIWKDSSSWIRPCADSALWGDGSSLESYSALWLGMG